MNTVPFPGEDSAEIVPPWASTIRRETERPSPVPPSLRVTNGSNKVSAMSEGIPHPLSRQRTMMVSSFRSADRKIDPSCPTASFALRSRFRNTCSSLTLSPVKSPMPDDILEENFIPEFAASRAMAKDTATFFRSCSIRKTEWCREEPLLKQTNHP